MKPEVIANSSVLLLLITMPFMATASSYKGVGCSVRILANRGATVTIITAVKHGSVDDTPKALDVT